MNKSGAVTKTAGVRAHSACVVAGRQVAGTVPGKSITRVLSVGIFTVPKSPPRGGADTSPDTHGGGNVVRDWALRRLREESAVRRTRRLHHDYSGGSPRRTQSADPEMRRQRAVVVSGSENDQEVVNVASGIGENRGRTRFKWAQKTVLMLVRIWKAILEVSWNNGPRTAVEMQWFTLNTSLEARKLAFNPSLYAQNRALAILPQWAVAILGKTPDDRSMTDCRRLHALLRGLPSFDKFTEQIQLAMCRSFSYLKVGEQRIILRKGHVGQNFYFIFSGSVFVNVEEVTSRGEVFAKTEVVLSKGDSFGELALLKDIRRTATISCRETCELLVVDKEVFAQVCPRIFEKELEEKISFLGRLPLFHSRYWGSQDLHQLCFESHAQEYKTSKVVVVDSTIEKWMYICMKGQCRIVKCLDLDEERQAEDSTSTLLRDDEFLTAEFLSFMNKNTERRRSNTGNRVLNSRSTSSVTSDKVVARKKQMLQSLGVEYLTIQQAQHKEDLLTRDANDKREEEHRKRSRVGVITLTTLMQDKMAESRHRDFVFLDIGTLKPGEVFDLAELLRPKPQEGARDGGLILVSSGARLCRVKKDTFRACLTPGAMEHAKHIAMKSMYPSNRVLLKSYKQQRGWEQYKDKVLDGVLSPCLRQARRRDIIRRQELLRRAEEHRRETRVLSTLRRHNDLHQSEFVDKATVGGSLDAEPEVVDHDDFESRLLREADDKYTGGLTIPYINPGFGYRRLSASFHSKLPMFN